MSRKIFIGTLFAIALSSIALPVAAQWDEHHGDWGEHHGWHGGGDWGEHEHGWRGEHHGWGWRHVTHCWFTPWGEQRCRRR